MWHYNQVYKSVHQRLHCCEESRAFCAFLLNVHLLYFGVKEGIRRKGKNGWFWHYPYIRLCFFFSPFAQICEVSVSVSNTEKCVCNCASEVTFSSLGSRFVICAFILNPTVTALPQLICEQWSVFCSLMLLIVLVKGVFNVQRFG